jgi:tRNA-splicing ligase RtcB
MIHSGSRGVGGKLHQEYNQIAKNLNRKYFSMVPEEAELAFLPKNSAEFNMFWYEMNYCMEWAKCNRKLMMNRIIDVIKDSFPDATFGNPIDIHHNYAAVEEHYGRQCIVHRKGAASAREGEIGIIPGSMGTCSYIVRGLGKPESFFSSSHGAGRAMSRGEAVATLDMKHEIDLLESQNIVHSIRNRNDLEEATSAYKNIDVVMTNQKDLVEIVTRLLPIAVIKG